MREKWLAVGLLAVGLLGWAVPARAGDTIRLADRVPAQDNAPAVNLLDDGRGADAVQACRPFWGGGYGRGFGGGFRVFGGWGGCGLRPFCCRPYVTPYVGFRYSYRSFGCGGYGLGGFGCGGCSGYGCGGYALGGYGCGGYISSGCVGLSPGFFPGSGGPAVTPYGPSTPGGYGFGAEVAAPVAPADPGPLQGAPVAPRGEQTFPYDGGPQAPVPMPGTGPAPIRNIRPMVPLEGRAVSLPRQPSKPSYPAYGEQPGRTSPAQDRALLTGDRRGK